MIVLNFSKIKKTVLGSNMLPMIYALYLESYNNITIIFNYNHKSYRIKLFLIKTDEMFSRLESNSSTLRTENLSLLGKFNTMKNRMFRDVSFI